MQTNLSDSTNPRSFPIDRHRLKAEQIDCTIMLPEDRRQKLSLLFILLFFLFAPLLILIATLEALILFGDVEFADLSVLELLELYLLDVVLLGLFALLVYRLMDYFLKKELPELLDTLDTEADDEEKSK